MYRYWYLCKIFKKEFGSRTRSVLDVRIRSSSWTPQYSISYSNACPDTSMSITIIYAKHTFHSAWDLNPLTTTSVRASALPLKQNKYRYRVHISRLLETCANEAHTGDPETISTCNFNILEASNPELFAVLPVLHRRPNYCIPKSGMHSFTRSYNAMKNAKWIIN
jgi:hypothetical protein